ncbi:hypothetical protein PAXRUDRAFT_825639 [Paxillus rubicundulus Ve08.2h10]|uniref:Unplaced genomic scaffold scaffold_149, whole genome shotgun sequence n=1 Tax=Paxillus rubicundulus Ve08.2h10 TaxID=930991 RepID=A0A0D0E0C8_9AGAM|nr:hypothetical protein PAXRUDRAFT_825639 [Paxillus rubicundulus Ve08.2h10]
MFAAKSRTWFELCFVPLVPLRSKHIWMCGICQLQAQMQPGWEPPLAHPGGYQYPVVQNQSGPSAPMDRPQNDGKGYQPGYIHSG